jgi:adenosylcobinamide-GDP ribazoletransferase
MTALTQFIRQYLLAIQFFTRIPITGRLAQWVGYSPELMRASAAHFPGVGLVVGTLAAAVYALLQALLPDTTYAPLVAAVFSTMATVLLTGGFHEDGLADVADGLGGSFERQRALEIMKDSRVGAYGAMALVLVLLGKVGLVAILGSVEGIPVAWEASPFAAWYVCVGLLSGHIVSRSLPLAMIRLLPYAGESATSKSRPLAGQMSGGALLIAMAWCLAALALASLALEPLNLMVACSFAVLALLWLLNVFHRRLQGFTGDCLGTTQQVCEIAFYLGLAVSL